LTFLDKTLGIEGGRTPVVCLIERGENGMNQESDEGREKVATRSSRQREGGKWQLEEESYTPAG